MSSFINKITNKTKKGSHSPPTPPPKNSEQQEPTYSILPHPAKTNDPRDLDSTGPQDGACSTGNAFAQVNNPGPYHPSAELWNNVEQPKSREELKARAAELNGR